jgi:uncharacterized protein YdhG (YjbR/CyaY superfamily)
MSIKSVLADNELELMQSKTLAPSGVQVYAINTSNHSAYDSSYMLITIDENAKLHYGYFEEVDSLFFYYDTVS